MFFLSQPSQFATWEFCLYIYILFAIYFHCFFRHQLLQISRCNCMPNINTELRNFEQKYLPNCVNISTRHAFFFTLSSVDIVSRKKNHKIVSVYMPCGRFFQCSKLTALFKVCRYHRNTRTQFIFIHFIFLHSDPTYLTDRASVS